MEGMQGPPSVRPAYVVPPVGPAPVQGVRWGTALAYGLGASFLGAVGWGAVLAATDSVFCLAGILVGVFVAWTVRKGAGRVNGSVIALAAALTMFSIFLGDLIGLSIIGAQYGLSVVDVIGLYPEIVAVTPTETLGGYAFGVIGVIVAVQYLWSEMRAQRFRAAPPLVYAPIPGIRPVPGAGLAPPAPADVEARVTDRSTFNVTMQVTVKEPPHTLEATCSSLTGRAKVFLDGELFQKGLVLTQKLIEVPVGGEPPRTIGFRFYGVSTPQIEVRVNGRVIAST